MSTVVVDDHVIEMPFKNVTQLHIRRRRPSHEYIENHIALESVSEDSSHNLQSPSNQGGLSLAGKAKSLRLDLDDVPFADPKFTRLGSLELSPNFGISTEAVEGGNAQRLREKLSNFIVAAHAAGQPCAAPWIDLDRRQPPPLQNNNVLPRVEPASPHSKFSPLDSGASFRSRRALDDKGCAKRSMSEGNVTQDIAWQRLISVGCSGPERAPASLGSFLTRRDSNSRRSSAASSTSASAAAAASPPRPAAPRPTAALPPAPPLGPPPACCSAADTMPAPDSPNGRPGGGARGPGRMRTTDKTVFRAQVAAALSGGRSVWL